MAMTIDDAVADVDAMLADLEIEYAAAVPARSSPVRVNETRSNYASLYKSRTTAGFNSKLKKDENVQDDETVPAVAESKAADIEDEVPSAKGKSSSAVQAFDEGDSNGEDARAESKTATPFTKRIEFKDTPTPPTTPPVASKPIPMTAEASPCMNCVEIETLRAARQRLRDENDDLELMQTKLEKKLKMETAALEKCQSAMRDQKRQSDARIRRLQDDERAKRQRLEAELEDAHAQSDLVDDTVKKLRSSIRRLREERKKEGGLEEYIFFKNEYTTAQSECERITSEMRDLTQEYHLVVDMLAVAKLDAERLRQKLSQEQLKSKALGWEISRLRSRLQGI